jgi:hypothetical protein
MIAPEPAPPANVYPLYVAAAFDASAGNFPPVDFFYGR